MRSLLLTSVVVLLAGCGVELLTTTAVRGELEAQQMTAMKRQLQGVAENTGQMNVERAIQTYRAEKGVNPPSLHSLVPHYLPALPVKADGTPYGYDPATGRLLDGPAAGGGPTAGDHEMMRQIRQAIDAYGTATGYYPPTLDELATQGYLAKAPRTSSGEPFIYNNQNGYVAHPHAAQAGGPAQPRRGGAGMGAGGPMGEMMTGMGVQQELNGMSNAGVNAAGSRARRSLGNTAGGRNDQVNRSMNELGL